MSEVITANTENFNEEVLQAKTPVLVDFWAPWCNPCKMMNPILKDLAKERSGQIKVVKVNIEEMQQLAIEYNVRSIPALLIFNEGALVQTKIGAINKTQLTSWVDESIA